MASERDLLIEASLDLAWSHWVGLGVRGTARPPSSAVDPEALLYFTACLADHDPRLRDEAGDWWKQFQRHISRPRLTALAGRFGESITAKLARFQETFTSETPTSEKSRLDHLNTPARSLLRLRCIFGANARAEVLLDLLTRRGQHDEGLTALALSEVGYSKRNIAWVLEDLALGGMITSVKEGNRVRYRLVDSAPLERVLRPLPRAPGRWHLRLPLLATFIELADRLHGRDAVVQGIEARKTLANLAPQIVIAAGGAGPVPSLAAETYWAGLQRWLVDNLIGQDPSAHDAESDRHITGMIEGAWFGLDQPIRQPARSTSAVLPRLNCNAVQAVELQCLDLVSVPTVEPPGDWTWLAMSTAATTTYAHTAGMNHGEHWRFATWAFDELRVYSAEYDEPLPPTRIAHLYGEAAAARARADRPAVQLRLRRMTY